MTGWRCPASRVLVLTHKRKMSCSVNGFTNVGNEPRNRKHIRKTKGESAAFSTFKTTPLSKGLTRRGKGGTCPGYRITGWRHKVPTVSQVLSSIQYIYSQNTLGSNTGAPNLFLVPGAFWPRHAPATKFALDSKT